MAEYIEREAVHDLVQSLTKYAWASPDNTGHRVTVDADDVNFAVDKIPSADVASVRHGRWFPTAKWWQGGSGWKRCSECGILHLGKSNFCPNCGCKMDLEG